MKSPKESPALLIIDMVKDNFDADHPLPITPLATKIIGPINTLIHEFRTRRWPVVFATDAFKSTDFIFKGHMKPHSLAGTPGAEVIDQLDRKAEDLWLPKPKFSAFFDTDLDKWLKERGVTLCAVGGIATNFCVLTTVMDAICHDFKAVLLEDCSAASTEGYHEQTLNLYRRNPLHPLLQILPSHELMEELKEQQESAG
ncbi:MAG: isochorismatase family cysteine hydrolase [Desulfatiglandaceae bacterium]